MILYLNGLNEKSEVEFNHSIGRFCPLDKDFVVFTKKKQTIEDVVEESSYKNLRLTKLQLEYDKKIDASSKSTRRLHHEKGLFQIMKTQTKHLNFKFLLNFEEGN